MRMYMSATVLVQRVDGAHLASRGAGEARRPGVRSVHREGVRENELRALRDVSAGDGACVQVLCACSQVEQQARE